MLYISWDNKIDLSISKLEKREIEILKAFKSPLKIPLKIEIFLPKWKKGGNKCK